jgi:hypothetical protein
MEPMTAFAELCKVLYRMATIAVAPATSLLISNVLAQQAMTLHVASILNGMTLSMAAFNHLQINAALSTKMAPISLFIAARNIVPMRTSAIALAFFRTIRTLQLIAVATQTYLELIHTVSVIIRTAL